MRSLFIIIGFCLLPLFAWSQDTDTTYLKEVTVFGLPVTPYNAGSKVERISAGDQIANLGDALTGLSSFYLKTYGNNQLATVAFRGTTASQTAVLWNGININSPTLGQTDFSLIPLFLFDEFAVHYGTASSLYGSDAIGGSVMLGQSAPDFKKRFDIGLYQQAGSFGRLSTGLKGSFGNERWQFKTKLYHSFIENNFPYTSPAVGYRQRQVNASVTNSGVDQQIAYTLSEREHISAEVMYTDNFRENQPAVTNQQANETLADKNLRAALMYHNNRVVGDMHISTAYQRGVQTYHDDNFTTTISNQFTAMFQSSRPVGERGDLRYGLNYNFYSASSANIHHPMDHRYDVFASYRHAISDRWIVNLNLRQSLYSQHYAPFSPSLGSEFYLKKDESGVVMFRGQIARGYRVPTLNDRYYVPGANPLIRPEDALQTEVGFNWSRHYENTSVKFGATGYRSFVKKMIVWLPGADDVWSPVNIQTVNITGLELSPAIDAQLRSIKINAGVNYSFTQSLNKDESMSQSATNNKQMPYVPLHSVRIFAAAETTTHWRLGANINFTSLRYSTIDNAVYSSLDPYSLTDFFLIKRHTMKKVSLDIKGEVRNLFDVYYENLKHHAMPGRNYAISLLIHFKPYHIQ